VTKGQGFVFDLTTFGTVMAACLPLVACSPPVASKQAEIHDSIDVWSVALSPDGQHLAVIAWFSLSRGARMDIAS
jgi:hypothetical protein